MLLLSDEEYLRRLGLPEGLSSSKVSKHLTDMMSKSLGVFMDDLEVVVLGTVETRDLRLRVSGKEREVTN